MIVPLAEDRRIRGTEHCWQLERKRTRAGKIDWTAYKYFQSFRAALGAAGEEAIRTASAETIAEAIEAISELTNHYGEVFEMNISRARRHERKMRAVS